MSWRRELHEGLRGTQTLDELEIVLLGLLTVQRSQGSVIFVSGSVFSDGEDRVADNIARLRRFTDHVAESLGQTAFSWVDVIYDSDLYGTLDIYHLPYQTRLERVMGFWRTILSSGHVTEVCMTPGWERSTGAQDEHRTAQQHALTIHYLPEIPMAGDTLGTAPDPPASA